MTKHLMVAAVMTLAAMATAMAQDTPPGQRVFNQCRSCHQVGPTAKNVIGPELNGLIGRTAGSVPGYNYSEANKASGIVWTEAVFAEYIKNPKIKIPGTKMAFAGLKDGTQVADLTAYLKAFKADGTPAQ
jgi:cytochrome c